MYLNRKTELGRQAALEDRGEGICYREYAVPLDEDPYDPEVWWRYIPAMGFTISERAVQHAADTMEEAEFRRAMLNQRNSSGAEQPLPLSVWARVLDRTACPTGVMALGVESALDASWSALVLADEDGQVELVEYREGTSWVPEEVAHLQSSLGCSVVLDPRGPARRHLRHLAKLGVEVEELSNPEVAEACLGFVDRVLDAALAVAPHDALNAAVEAGRRRWSGDQWYWDRRGDSVEVSPLVSATLAVYWAGTPRAVSSSGPSLVADVEEELYERELAAARTDYKSALAAILGEDAPSSGS